ncbi:MAG: hypothetical protein B0D82_02160, partial [Candidatus Sedimenticola endophacoides]
PVHTLAGDDGVASATRGGTAATGLQTARQGAAEAQAGAVAAPSLLATYAAGATVPLFLALGAPALGERRGGAVFRQCPVAYSGGGGDAGTIVWRWQEELPGGYVRTLTRIMIAPQDSTC